MNVTPIFRMLRLVVLVLPLLVFQNCTKEAISTKDRINLSENDLLIDTDLAEDLTVFEENGEDAIARNHHRITFHTLNAALDCTGLDAALFSGRKTLYAPSDEAFAKLGLNQHNICDAFDTESLTNILLYHVNEDIIKISKRGCIQPLNGDVARLDFTHGRYMINESRLTRKFSQNGKGYLLVVYVIDTVLLPPMDNIVETAVAADGFNALVAAVLAADPSVVSALSNDDAIFTVFAPTDKAFGDLLAVLGVGSLEEAVAAVGMEALTTILLYHVVDGCATSNDLRNDMMITTLQGESVRVDLKNKTIVDKTGTGAPLVKSGLNIRTANGFIHTIDKVLLPQAILDAL